MSRVHQIIAAMSTLALVSSPLEQACAQTEKQQLEFERPLENSSCVPGSTEYHPDYPFSVDRLAAAIKINDAAPSEVHVLIVDNGFLGYRSRKSEEEGSSFIESDNYPMSFFDILGKDFLPYFDTTDAGAIDAEVDPMKGHGTYVGGIILGGMYQAGEPKAGGANLLAPNVKRLLLNDPEVPDAKFAKPWLKIRYAPLGYGVRGAKTDPIDKLGKALRKNGGASTSIINMSLARVLTSLEPYELPEGVEDHMLVVLAAGNATMQLVPGVGALPAMIEKSDQLLIVGSHDADGKLSHFSNYGTPVSIAAPGCQIRSWADGDGDPQSLSGTSMSTAVVSFAAAIVRSQWPVASGAALRHRLLVSARYDARLAECERSAAHTKIESDPRECVEHGAMLDIEGAVVVSKDLIEYEECPDESGENCMTYTRVGALSSVPQSLRRCVYPLTPTGYFGLTKNAAVKRISGGFYFDCGRAWLHCR